MVDLPYYSADTPMYPVESLKMHIPELSDEGLDLLDSMLRCNPQERISAKEAMHHPYCKDVPHAIRKMK